MAFLCEDTATLAEQLWQRDLLRQDHRQVVAVHDEECRLLPLSDGLLGLTCDPVQGDEDPSSKGGLAFDLWRCCMARNEATFPLLSTHPQATTFTDSGIPSAVIRLMTLTAINASRF